MNANRSIVGCLVACVATSVAMLTKRQNRLDRIGTAPASCLHSTD
jgi:hypothetical protein